MCISPLSITRLLGSKFCSFLYPWNLEVPGMVGIQEGKERDWKCYPNGQAASALPSEWAMWHFHGIKWGVAAACHPKYLFTHLLVAQKLCSKLLIHKRRLLGPAQRYSYSRVRERQVTGTGLAFWAIWSALRISATELCRGYGGGEGTKRAVEMGRSGRPWTRLCLQDQFC